ncbi:MAG: magnesium transporter [Gammaproteobacteria bacterium]|nr:magnesium transporter [Gammaproteobacteria bacterium]
MTASAAALVVFFYSDTVENAVILAVVMPVIAGMGGNAGSQALAVTVRRLALRDDVGADPGAVVSKEVLVGLVNGAVLGGIVAGASLLVPGGDPRLGLVVLISMWGTMLMAGFGGAFIPMLLHRWGFDPAVASSVFLHTTTDFLGFMLLLGLATALLM